MLVFDPDVRVAGVGRALGGPRARRGRARRARALGARDRASGNGAVVARCRAGSWVPPRSVRSWAVAWSTCSTSSMPTPPDPVAALDLGRGSASLTGAVLGAIIVGQPAPAQLLGVPVGAWADAAAVPLLVAIGGGKLALLLGGAGLGAPWDGALGRRLRGRGTVALGRAIGRRVAVPGPRGWLGVAGHPRRPARARSARAVDRTRGEVCCSCWPWPGGWRVGPSSRRPGATDPSWDRSGRRGSRPSSRWLWWRSRPS